MTLRSLLTALALLASGCEPWRSVPPVVSERFDIVLPKFVRYDLPSGLTVLSSRNTDGGLVHLELVMRAGYDFDPPGKEGLARLVANVLEASARLPRNDLRFGTIGATPRVRVDRDGLRVEIDVLQADAPAGVRALAEFVVDPVQVGELLEPSRESCRAELARAFGSPDALAAIAIARTFSPWKDRQSVLGLGTEASLATLTSADVEQWLVPLRNTRDSALVVTGPHDVALAEDWALAAFARWPQTQIRRRSGAAKVLPRDRETIFVPTSDMQQTLIVVGGLRPRPEDADAPAFDAGHDLFRGAVTQVLREELRLSYGTHGLWEEDDAFSLAIRVRADKTRVALKEIARALDEIPDLPTAHWLDLRRVAGSVALMDDAQDSDAMGDVAREIFLRAIPLDALQVQMKALHMLDDNALSRSIASHFHPSRVRIVVVGDPKRMKDQLDKFVEWTPEILLGS